MNIPYKYESKLTIAQNKIMYPDFTCLNVKKRKTIYWEHLGLLDNYDYSTKNFAKIDPNPLTIKITKDNEIKMPSVITIQNLTNKFLIFKFLINNKGILLAKPSTSYILPVQNISVEINIYNNNLSLNELQLYLY